MKSFLKRWWSPLITHPVAFLAFAVGLPFVVHKLHYWHALTHVLIGVFAITSLVLLAKIHGYSQIVIAFIVSAIGGIVFATWPQEVMGNWNIQVADHILMWAIVAFIISAVLESLFLARGC